MTSWLRLDDVRWWMRRLKTVVVKMPGNIVLQWKNAAERFSNLNWILNMDEEVANWERVNNKEEWSNLIEVGVGTISVCVCVWSETGQSDWLGLGKVIVWLRSGIYQLECISQSLSIQICLHLPHSLGLLFKCALGSSSHASSTIEFCSFFLFVFLGWL